MAVGAGEPISAPRRRMENLDAVRAIAGVAVVVSHALQVYPDYQRMTLQWFGMGHIGVCLLFMLSGFVLPGALARRSMKDFWIGRIARLYPAYWAFLTLYILIAYAGFIDSQSSRNLPLVALNYTAMQSLAAKASIVGSHWTMAFFMVVYGVFALVAMLGWRNRYVELAYVSIGGLAVFSVVQVVFQKSVPSPAAFVAMGVLGGALADPRMRGAKGVALSLAMLAAFVAFHYTAPSREASMLGTLPRQAPSYVFGEAFAIGLFLLFLNLEHVKFPRWWVVLGQAGFSLYLLHPVVLAATRNYVPKEMAVFLTISLSIPLAVLSYRWIEMPAYKGLLARFTSRPASSA